MFGFSNDKRVVKSEDIDFKKYTFISRRFKVELDMILRGHRPEMINTRDY